MTAAHIVRFLDRDGDGKVSLADLEATASDTFVRCEEWWHRAEEHFQGGPWCKAGVGMLMLFYGGHFKATALVAFSLRSSTIAVFKAQIAEIMEEYGRVRGGLQAQLVTPETNLNRAPPSGIHSEALPVAIACAESRPLIGGLQRLSNTVLAQVAMALNQSTMTFGVGIHFSRRLADLCSSYVEQIMLGDVDAASEANQRQVRIIVESACTAIGLATAWLLKGWAALWSTCLQGAQLCFDSMALTMDLQGADLAPDRVAFLTTTMGVVGFFYQAQYWGKPAVPWILQPVLLPLKGMEGLLTSVV
mmetsp:Transcript_55987/g.133410  ORF Transcript_55987/g.133410 Transcript_55987/m.133410 type:complete len:304 (-) Transcript_55987:159-1070(-)